MSTTEAVFFDLDGTLIDTSADFVATISQWCQELNHPYPGDNSIRNTVSDGARALVELTFNSKEGDDGFENLRQELLDRYERDLGKAAKLFDGMQSVLSYCRTQKIAWGIVTNKPRRFTQPLIEQLFADNKALYPDIIICPDHVSQTKPDPEGLFKACKHVGSSPEHSIYVGDHIRDIEAAHNAKMTSIACSYGYIKSNENIESWNASLIIEHASELLHYLQSPFAEA